MNRRSFLKEFAASIEALSIGLRPKSVPSTREQLISQSLDTPEDRKALAQAMVEPIQRSLEYQAVGRNLLMVDELPQAPIFKTRRFPIIDCQMIKANEWTDEIDEDMVQFVTKAEKEMRERKKKENETV